MRKTSKHLVVRLAAGVVAVALGAAALPETSHANPTPVPASTANDIDDSFWSDDGLYKVERHLSANREGVMVGTITLRSPERGGDYLALSVEGGYADYSGVVDGTRQDGGIDIYSNGGPEKCAGLFGIVCVAVAILATSCASSFNGCQTGGTNNPGGGGGGDDNGTTGGDNGTTGGG